MFCFAIRLLGSGKHDTLWETIPPPLLSDLFLRAECALLCPPQNLIKTTYCIVHCPFYFIFSPLEIDPIPIFLLEPQESWMLAFSEEITLTNQWTTHTRTFKEKKMNDLVADCAHFLVACFSPYIMHKSSWKRASHSRGSFELTGIFPREVC